MTSHPVHDLGPAMKGVAIAGLGILHVFLAPFAIGGGMLMPYFPWPFMNAKKPAARTVLDSYVKY